MKLSIESVRAANQDDHAAIRSIFTATVALGRPVTVDGITDYADFSLRWYFDGAGEVGVHLDDARINGYVLIGTDEDDHERRQRRLAARYLAALARLAVRGRLRGDAATFHRLRLRDGWTLYNAGPVCPAAAHIHLNLLPTARATQAARRLVDFADQVVDAAGHPSWYAQINAPVGRRAAAIERLGGVVIDRAPNLTLTHLVGEPVERLTIVRTL